MIAILSDEAREAQVAQARALLDAAQGRARGAPQADRAGHAAEARSWCNLEAQLKAAEAALAQRRSRARARRRARAVVRHRHRVPVEVGQAAFSMAGKEIAQIVALDPMLAVVEVAERKLAGVKVGDKAEIRLVTGADGGGQDPLRLEVREPDHAHLSGRGRDRQCRRRDSGRHHRRSRAPARAGAGDARAALGADLLVGRRARRAHGRRRRARWHSCRSRSRGRAATTCGSPASPTARG